MIFLFNWLEKKDFDAEQKLIDSVAVKFFEIPVETPDPTPSSQSEPRFWTEPQAEKIQKLNTGNPEPDLHLVVNKPALVDNASGDWI